MKYIKIILLIQATFLMSTFCQHVDDSSSSVIHFVNHQIHRRQVTPNKNTAQVDVDDEDLFLEEEEDISLNTNVEPSSSRSSNDDIDDLIEDFFRSSTTAATHRDVTNNNTNNYNTGEIDLTPTNNDNGQVMPQKSNGCQCVPYYLCRNNKIVTDGEGLLEIRLNSGCKNSLDVCCEYENKILTPIIRTTSPRSVEKFTGCGQRNIDGVGFRITGDKDNEAQFGEFPWMVAIMNLYDKYQCGGSLIHPKVVLTAAHCVANRQKQRELKVRVGEWDTQTENEVLQHQERVVVNVTIHPDYYAGGLFNDIALLYLNEPVKLVDNVGTICLPSANVEIDYIQCLASGWGKDQFGQQSKDQVILKRVELPIVPRYQCEAMLRTTRLGAHFKLDKSFICAGGERGRDTCKGDGGGPLVCPVKGTLNRYHQVGIISWGIGCGDNIPGVYTNVPLLKHWIDEQMSCHNLALDYYAL